MAMIMGPSSRASVRPPLKVGERSPRASERAGQELLSLLGMGKTGRKEVEALE